jgi:hypothetical protein
MSKVLRACFFTKKIRVVGAGCPDASSPALAKWGNPSEPPLLLRAYVYVGSQFFGAEAKFKYDPASITDIFGFRDDFDEESLLEYSLVHFWI